MDDRQERAVTAAARAHEAFEAVHAAAVARTRPLFDARSRAIVEALAAGVPGTVVAQKLGMSYSRVYQLAREWRGQ